MKAKSFRIRNYKSIEDSGECWLSPGITILAGKNESGKSAVLEALRDFSPQISEFPPDAFPITSDKAPAVMLRFECDPIELARRGRLPTLSREAVRYLKRHDLQIWRLTSSGHSLDAELVSLLDRAKVSTDPGPKLDQLLARYEDLLSEYSVSKRELAGPFEEDSQELAALLADLEKSGDEDLSRFVSEYRGLWQEGQGYRPSAKILTAALSQLPTIVFFSDFADAVLPFEIPLGEQPTPIVEDLLSVADLNLATIAEMRDLQRRMNQLRRKSATVSGDFRSHWKQDKVKLTFGSERENLVVEVHEDQRQEGYKVSQRSKGFQWFLTFYLRLQARGAKTSNLILIDEPGLFLHAQAQKDVLGVLENLCTTSQVIFSTHSAHLIDPDRLDRIRLVIKDAKGHPGTTLVKNPAASCGALKGNTLQV